MLVARLSHSLPRAARRRFHGQNSPVVARVCEELGHEIFAAAAGELDFGHRGFERGPVLQSVFPGERVLHVAKAGLRRSAG
jgi:hypothetical protein